MAIGDDLQGNIDVYSISSLSIGGDALGDIEADLITGAVAITGSVSGNINVTDEIQSGGSLTISEDVASTSSITILKTVSGASVTISGDVAGVIGVPNGCSGTLTIVGTLTSDGDVGLGEAGEVFSGTATIGATVSGSSVHVCGSDVSGTIHVLNDMDGAIGVAGNPPANGGNLLSTGLIRIDGNLCGSVYVATDAAGEIRIGDDITSDGGISINGDLTSTGDINVTGDIDGDVDIGGVMTGEICADNLSAAAGLPGNVDIASFGPYWTICGELGCTCDDASCSSVDCNSNDELDICEILDGTYEDCDGDDIPDAGGSCDPTNQDAQLYTSDPEDEDSWWRSQNNIARLTFYCDVDAPDSGDVTIQEMEDEGAFGDDLSDSFDFTIEDDDNGDPRILKIEEDGSVLTHGTWYSIRNTGDWSGVADFEVQYLLQMGDCDNTGTVASLDVDCVNAAIPCFTGCGDDRREDMNGDGLIISLDVGVVNGHIPSSAVTKPSGH